jgi:hypothetical protein
MFKLKNLINFFCPTLMLDSGGGGGGSAPANQTIKQENAVSAYAAPYVENMLGKSEALTNQPYQNYTGQRIADFTGLQNKTFDMASGPEGFSQNIGGYMSPYMQNVVDIQKREAARQSGIAGLGQQAQAVQAGGFGGSRDAIMRAERERNLNMQMNDIQAQGLQSAFANAQNQFNTNLGQMAQFGTQQQQQQQNVLNQQYGDFQAQKQDPYNKLAFQQSMLSGLPISSSTQSVYSNPSMLSQVAGLGTAAAGAYGLANMGNRPYAEGGQVNEDTRRPAGLAELAIYRMA